MRKKDARSERTEAAVKSALLEAMAAKELEDIGVAEIARAAGISRSTFYAHYQNLGEVFQEMVGDLQSKYSPLVQQLRCDACQSGERQPFCMRIRNAGVYQPVVDSPRFLEAVLEVREGVPEGDIYAQLVDAGLPQDVARAVYRFQMSGCYAAARDASLSDAADWERVRAALDVFIRGGIAALRNEMVR